MKPVAYVNWNTGNEISMDFLPAILFDKLVIENKQDYEPLYTHPVKQLSEERLRELVYDNSKYDFIDITQLHADLIKDITE